MNKALQGINLQTQNRNKYFGSFLDFIQGKKLDQKLVSGLGKGKWLFLEIESNKIKSCFNEQLALYLLRHEKNSFKISASLSAFDKIKKGSLSKLKQLGFNLSVRGSIIDANIKKLSLVNLNRFLTEIEAMPLAATGVSIYKNGKKIAYLENDCLTLSNKSLINPLLKLINVKRASDLVCYVEITGLRSWKGIHSGHMIILNGRNKIRQLSF